MQTPVIVTRGYLLGWILGRTAYLTGFIHGVGHCYRLRLHCIITSN